MLSFNWLERLTGRLAAGRRKERGVREKHRGERECLPERPIKIVSRPLSNKLQPLGDPSKMLTEND